MFIGDIEIPIVYLIEEVGEAEVDEINPLSTDKVPVKHKSQIDTVTITGFVNVEIHSSSLPLDEQVAEVKSLRGRPVVENSIDYREYKGHLAVENVDFSDNSDSKIVRDFEIEARYLPWPKYYPENEP